MRRSATRAQEENGKIQRRYPKRVQCIVLLRFLFFVESMVLATVSRLPISKKALTMTVWRGFGLISSSEHFTRGDVFVPAFVDFRSLHRYAPWQCYRDHREEYGAMSPSSGRITVSHERPLQRERFVKPTGRSWPEGVL